MDQNYNLQTSWTTFPMWAFTAGMSLHSLSVSAKGINIKVQVIKKCLGSILVNTQGQSFYCVDFYTSGNELCINKTLWNFLLFHTLFFSKFNFKLFICFQVGWLQDKCIAYWAVAPCSSGYQRHCHSRHRWSNLGTSTWSCHCSGSKSRHFIRQGKIHDPFS